MFHEIPVRIGAFIVFVDILISRNSSYHFHRIISQFCKFWIIFSSLLRLRLSCASTLLHSNILISFNLLIFVFFLFFSFLFPYGIWHIRTIRPVVHTDFTTITITAGGLGDADCWIGRCVESSERKTESSELKPEQRERREKEGGGGNGARVKLCLFYRKIRLCALHGSFHWLYGHGHGADRQMMTGMSECEWMNDCLPVRQVERVNTTSLHTIFQLLLLLHHPHPLTASTNRQISDEITFYFFSFVFACGTARVCLTWDLRVFDPITYAIIRYFNVELSVVFIAPGSNKYNTQVCRSHIRKYMRIGALIHGNVLFSWLRSHK